MQNTHQDPKPSCFRSRRKFLHRGLWTVGAITSATIGLSVYGYVEASYIRIHEQTIELPRLPASFDGMKVAVLGDFHHSSLVSLDFIRGTVSMAETLQADACALVGDFIHYGKTSHQHLLPCLRVLSQLSGSLGVYCVPGNHDLHLNRDLYHSEVAKTSLTDLTNRAVPMRRNNETLWFAGVDDLWWGTPDQESALANVPADEAVILLSHNPDFAEDFPDPRVDLILSGHTHGGQAHFPWIGSPWIPSKYGDKYRHGLVEGPQSKVFVTRGIGETGIPIRVNSPPEINLLTLKKSESD